MQLYQQKLTPLTESGLLAALSVVLAFAAVYLPVIGIVATLIWPLPVLVLVVRHGLRWGVMGVLTAGVLMALVLEPMLAVRMVLSFGFTGLALGWGFRKDWSGAKIFGIGLLSSVIGKLGTIGLLFFVTGIDPLDAQLDALNETFDQTFSLYETIGIPAAELEQSREQIQQGMKFVTLLIPLVVLFMGLFDTTISYLLGGKVLRRLGHDVRTMPPFSEWRLPRFFVYLFGFALVGIYWGGSRQIDWLYKLSMNLEILAICAGFVQGLSLLSYLMKHYKLAGFWRFMIYVIVLFSGFLLQLVAFSGLVDIVFDYRRRFERRPR